MNENKLPNRKLQRLQGYDYSTNGSYFITQCIQNKKCLLGDVRNGKMVLNDIGNDFNFVLLELAKKYDDVLYKYVFMPNHAHFLFLFDNNEIFTVQDFMRDFKSITTVNYIRKVKSGIYQRFDRKIWQKSFYDRIIRNENEFLAY